MKKLSVIIILTMLFFSSLVEAKGFAPRFSFGGPAAGGGGDPIITIRTFNSTALNKLANDLGVPELKQPMFAIGGVGYGFFGHVRVGGQGAGGKISSLELVNGVERELELNYGYGGFLPEYIGKRGAWTLSAGCQLGGGGLNIRISDDGEEVISSKKGFFCLEPNLGVKVKLVPFASIQTWVGYMIVASDKFVFKYNNKFYRIKASEMSGLQARIGIVFGGDE